MISQIGSSIFAVAPDERFRIDLVKYFSRRGRRDKSQRPQAIVLEAIRPIPEKDVPDVARKQDRCLAVKDIATMTGQVSEEWTYDPISAKATGGYIRPLGFTTKRTKHGYRFAVDPKKLPELLKRYGLKQ